MLQFENLKNTRNDHEAMEELSRCAYITMEQYCPEIDTLEKFENNIDMDTIYKIIKVAAGIRVNPKEEREIKEQAEDGGATWEDLELAKIESEVFLLGIWKDYEELESSMSMPEIFATLSSKRELDKEEKTFLAAIQGIDLNKADKKQEDPWEAMKARVFSGGQTGDPNDIVSFQGVNAAKAGFGIGMGLDYEDKRK